MNPTIWFELAKDIKHHRQEFYIVPSLWERYGVARGLKWERVDFLASSKTSLPDKKGLYAMTIRAPNPDFPPNSYLFYVGEVGAKSSEKRTFPRRFQEYLDEYRQITRPNVAIFLHSYRGYIDFHYCELDESADIKSLESDLITYLLPIANRRDIEPEIGIVRRAFG